MPTPKKIYSHLEHPEVRIIKQIEEYSANAEQFLKDIVHQIQKFSAPQQHAIHPKPVKASGISRLFKSQSLADKMSSKPEHHEPSRASFISSATVRGFEVQQVNVEDLVEKLSPKHHKHHEHLIVKAQGHSQEIDKLLNFITSEEFLSPKNTQEFVRKISI